MPAVVSRVSPTVTRQHPHALQRHTLGGRRDNGDADARTDGPPSSRSYWHDSQVGSSMAQNLGSGSCKVWASLDERGTAESRAFLPAPAADALPDSATALSSPPCPVD